MPAGASAYKPAIRASEWASEYTNERSGASGDNGKGDQSVNVNLNECRKKRDFSASGEGSVCLARGRNERRLFSLASSRCTLLCSVPNALLCRSCSVFLSSPLAPYLLLCSSSSVSALAMLPCHPANPPPPFYLSCLFRFLCRSSPFRPRCSPFFSRQPPQSRKMRARAPLNRFARSLSRSQPTRLSPRRNVRFESTCLGNTVWRRREGF